MAELGVFLDNDTIRNGYSNYHYRSPAFCNCLYPKSATLNINNGIVKEKFKCRCGENEGHDMEWLWELEPVRPECYINGPNVIFHPIYSQGTSVVRADKRLAPKMIHYWEIKILTPLSGTDVMVGIGTNQMELLAYAHNFVSVLGLDNQSWGFSYRGLFQHDGVIKYYGKKFSQGCIVGIYVDLFKGLIEFYINRRSLGVASRNIPRSPCISLYPMACSTAAKSSIRLINSTCFNETLQFQAMRIVSKQPKLLEKLNTIPGLKYLIDKYWFLIPSFGKPKLKSSLTNLALEDEAIINVNKTKKFKLDEDDSDDSNDDFEIPWYESE